MRRKQIVLTRQQRRGLSRTAATCADASLKTAYLIIAHSAGGWSKARIAAAVGCSVSTVGRVRQRWHEDGAMGLADKREDNGPSKVDDTYIFWLLHVLKFTPQDYGHRRPTWTQRLLIETVRRFTAITISRSTMCRLLKALGIRRGRPKPAVGCPWSARAKSRRFRMIRQLIDSLTPDEVAVWEDEVDIDLNPRIGPDWMLPGTQRQVMTPGKNIKRYLAGAMDARSDRLVWVKGERKNSDLFITLLKKLLKVYADKKVIHVILDNFKIHSSRRTRLWLEEHGRRLRLHFLPPYCPDDNRIERCVWRELHANVTVNHRCSTIEELLIEASDSLAAYNRRVTTRRGSELRKAI
jgi:transposase